MKKINLKKIKLTKGQIKILILSAMAAIICIVLTIVFWPTIRKLSEPETQEKFSNWVESFGSWGILVLILVQILQVVIFIIPGEIVEVGAGLLYGTIGGYLICTIGIIIATLIAYFLHYLFGKKFIKKMVDDETIEKVTKSSTKAEVLIFFALLFPGIPKDVFIYVAPYAKIPFLRFIIISTIARFPSVISSNIMGDSIIKGHFKLSIFIMISSAIIALLGIIFNKQITEFIDSHSKKMNYRINNE